MNRQWISEAVLCDLALWNDVELREKSTDRLALISLELDDIAHLVLDHGAVGVEHALHVLQNLFQIEIVRQALHGRHALSAVALLHANVYSRLVLCLLREICLLEHHQVVCHVEKI